MNALNGATVLRVAYLGSYHQVSRIPVEYGASSTLYANVAKDAGKLVQYPEKYINTTQ